MNPLRRLLKPIALAGGLALGALALGQTQGYVAKTRTINAAVLLLDADKPNGLNSRTNQPYVYGQTAAPFAFYNLDQATGVKPSGWSFVNPYAPGQVTTLVKERYYEDLFVPTTSQPSDYQPIRKQNGAYWTVSLSNLNDTQLSNYNVLLIAPRSNLSLNSNEREKLRRFVDGGGVLWVELANGSLDTLNNLPYALNKGATSGNTFRDAGSPLINGVRRVSDADLAAMMPNAGTVNGPVMAPPASNNASNYLALPAEYLRYRGVAYVNGSPVIAQARIGEGALVVTTRGVATELNEDTVAQPGPLNVNYTGRAPALNAQGRSAARLAINIVGLTGGYEQADAGSRKTRSDLADTPAPVLSRFNVEGSFGPNNSLTSGAVTSQPVVYKGFLVATIGNRLCVFDPVPGRDLDGDGDPDDGIVDGTGNVQLSFRDSSVGKTMDLIWCSDPIPNAPLSGPTCAEVPDVVQGNLNSINDRDLRDQILVTDSRGALHIYYLKLLVNGRLRGGVIPDADILAKVIDAPNVSGAVSAASYNSGAGLNPNAPTVYENLAYMADTTDPTGFVGRVWVVDLTTGQTVKTTSNGMTYPWVVGGPGAGGTGLPAFTSSPTIGYIPSSDGSGGVERVLYSPGISTTNAQPTLVSLWLGSRNERPFSVVANGSTISITTRAGANGQVPIYYPPVNGSPAQLQMAPRISIMDANGNPVDVSTFFPNANPSDGGPGVINLAGFTSANNDFQGDFVAKGYSFRVDYTIDWGADPATYSATIERGRLLLPIRRTPSADQNQRILGAIALTTRGTLHVVEGPLNGNLNGTVGGSYFAIREDGGKKGQFRVVARFSLYDGHTETVNNVGVSVLPALSDNDNFIKGIIASNPAAASFYKDALTSLRYAGGVALRNGVAYTTINAGHGFVPVTMVAAFKAEPDTPEIRIGSGMGANPVLQQVDVQRNTQALSGLVVSSRLSASQMTVDTDNGILRLENLATVNAGEITDCINLSQPVQVGWTGQPLTMRQPDAEGDRWTQILWYGLWNGGTATTGPLLAGDEVYLAANSFLPNLLGGNGLKSSGVVWSIDADLSTTGTFVAYDKTRPWLAQQLQLNPNGDPNNFASPYYRMPQNKGVTDTAGWVLRLEQTKLGNSAVAYGIAGGEGTVTAFGDQGLYGLSRADIVVCDEGRLIRVDSVGNPVSSAFGGRFSGIGNGSASSTYKPLVRPVKAYPVGENEFLVVDAGANRVVRLDEDGTELRAIDRITLDPAFKPAAYRANEPLTLNDPRDAATYEGYVFQSQSGTIVSNQQPIEYWVRTIIADSGNGRVVELADRYFVDQQTGRIGAPITIQGNDPTTGLPAPIPQVGVLVWQSPALDQATKIGDYYNSISRVFIGNVGTGRYVYVAGVSKTRPTRVSVGLDNPGTAGASQPNGAGGGAIVIFDPLGGTRVFDRFGLPNTTGTPFFDPTNSATVGNFDTATAANRPAQNNRPFSGLQAVTASTIVSNNNVAIRLMATDADAVYEFWVDSNILGTPGTDPTKDPADSTGATSLRPIWSINEAAFTALRRTGNGPYDVSANARAFRPAFARRLDSGEILVVNGYRGLTRGGAEYKGEVVLLDGSSTYNLTLPNLGFDLGSLHFDLSTLNGSARDLVSPVFADRK